MAEHERPKSPTVAQRLRRASTSVTGVVMNYNPQQGMWAATGTAIAYAPTLEELREPVTGGRNIVYNAHGHSARSAPTNPGSPTVTAATEVKQPTILERTETVPESSTSLYEPTSSSGEPRVVPKEKHNGFLMTIYGLNIVAWGAMLFFLLLDAAPAMDHPNKDSDDSPRKKWIEIDSQILNGLFCVTGFGLAPWRFRDLYWMVQARFQHNQHAMMRLCKQNESWFRPPRWYHGVDLESGQQQRRVTFTGKVAPPTRLWKLSFVVWMMIFMGHRSLHWTWLWSELACWSHDVVGGPKSQKDRRAAGGSEYRAREDRKLIKDETHRRIPKKKCIAREAQSSHS